MENKRLIGTTRNGISIYAINDDAHMAAHSSISDMLLTEAIKMADYSAPFWMESIDLGRIIGSDNCVSVTADDDVRMLYRKGRKGKTPIVFGKTASDTSIMTIGICKDDDGLDTIFTAFTGINVPKEPWDPRLSDANRAEAEEFWATHALVYDESAIDPERN